MPQALAATLLILLAWTGPALANNPAGTYWSPDRNAKIEVFEQDGLWHGRIVWTETEALDVENADPALRSRPVKGILMIEGFTPDKDGVYTGGTVYAADDGKTYKGKFWLDDDNNLKLRGYVGISLFGRTATLVRI